jgi:quinol monooxygenase YgiN
MAVAILGSAKAEVSSARRNLRCTPMRFRDRGHGGNNPDMEFVVIAQYRVRAGEEDKVAAALREMVAPTRAEPGNLDYQVFRDPADRSLFAVFEKYADAAAFDAHRASGHFATWLAGQALPALAGRVRLDLVPINMEA